MTETKYCFKKIGIASDHAGKELKTEVLAFLKDRGIECVDYGVPHDSTDRVDYPDYAARLAEDVSKKKVQAGVAICGSGIGMSIVANKFPGIRAVCAWDEFSARMSRAHNDTNILCLGSRALGSYRAKDLIEIWLTTSFAGEQHEIRIDKINEIEKKLFSSKP